MRSTKLPGGLIADAETVAVLLAREQDVFGVVAVLGIRRDVGRHLHEVAVDVINFVVGPEDERVRTVFAARAVEFSQELDFVVLIVAIGVANAIEAELLGPVAADVETVEGVEQAHRAPDRHIDLLQLLDLARLAERDAQHVAGAFLRRNDEAAFGIDGHADP